MSNGAGFSALPRVERIRIIVWSGARVVIGIAFILFCLALVPERPTSLGFLPALIMVGGAVLYILFFRRQLTGIRHARFPIARATEALILTAAMFLAIFAAIYVLVSANDPGAFTEPLTRFSAYYFSLTVLATVGFGDISPTSTLARSICMVQMALDLAFIAVTVRVLTTVARQAMSARQAGTTGE